MRARYWVGPLVVVATVCIIVLYNKLAEQPASEHEIATSQPPETPKPAATPTPEKPKPCNATFSRVTKGMSLSEVVATVGAPPGIHIHGELGSDVVCCSRGLGWSGYTRWVADDGELLVLFCSKEERPIWPKEVKSDDRAAEVHIWDVMRLHP